MTLYSSVIATTWSAGPENAMLRIEHCQRHGRSAALAIHLGGGDFWGGRRKRRRRRRRGKHDYKTMRKLRRPIGNACYAAASGGCYWGDLDTKRRAR